MAIISERKKKDGTASFRAEIRIKRGGKIVYRETQTWPKRKMAEQWAALREMELAAPGALDKLIAQGGQAPLTVAELIERYIEIAYPIKPWGRNKTAVLRQLASSDLGQKIAQNIVSADIIDHCRNWGAGPATANTHYVFLRGVFSVSEDLLRCPVQFAEIEKAQRTMSKLGIIAKSGERDRRPTVDEMTTLVSHFYQRRVTRQARKCDRDDYIFMDKVLVFAMFSGRRQEEICRINRTDTDYERQRVLVRDMKHPGKKAGNDVWCYVPDEAWRVMLSMPQKAGDDRWFPYYSRSLSDRFRQGLKDNAMWQPHNDEENLHFHDLRHECASWLFERDGYNGQRWDVPRVASVTGHQSWNSLKRYTQIENSVPNDKWENWEWAQRVCD